MSTLVSLIVPAFNEASNLGPFYEAVSAAFAGQDLDWEMIVVDDHSNDRTPYLISSLAQSDPHVRGVRLARNSGSHNAVRCGLRLARGDLIGIIAADLQDPPHVLVEMAAELRRGGHHVVWAVRERRDAVPLADRLFSRAFHGMMRHIMGRADMPLTNADFVVFDRRVAAALRGMRETNVNVFALIQWAGFRQAYVRYVKGTRRHGDSGWRLHQKLKLAVDSIVGFSYMPIRLMTLVGIATAMAGFLYTVVVLFNYFLGRTPTEGWSSLMIVLLLVGGINLIAMGVLGEYIWRALDEIRGRSPFLIEAELGGLPVDAAVPAPSDPGADGMLGLVQEANHAGTGEPSSH
jgi:glycosyltransferase involved in cell wall biosynthesis